jgi:hypothetical protein
MPSTGNTRFPRATSENILTTDIASEPLQEQVLDLDTGTCFSSIVICSTNPRTTSLELGLPPQVHDSGK